MTRVNQLIRLYRRPTKKHKIKCKDLKACPQKRAICDKLLKTTPRKPNSALRRVTWAMISSTRKFVFAYIPGDGENPLKKFSKILIRGGGPKDLPGLKYRAMPGQKKFDLPALEARRTSRSKYGVKRPLEKKNDKIFKPRWFPRKKLFW